MTQTATSSTASEPLTIELSLAALPSYSFTVDTADLGEVIAGTSSQQPDLRGVIVTTNQQAVGVISRRTFFERLGHLYGVSVYMNRPIGVMLETINATPLILDETTAIYKAAQVALNRPPALIYEPVVVACPNNTYRLLDFDTLLLAQTEILSDLRHQLQLAKQEVEHRYEQSQQRAKELAEAKEAAEMASRAKSDFLAKMSHELRTPLNGVLGYTQILKQEPQLSPQQEKGLDIIHKSGEYLLTLINDILDLAKIEAGRMELYPAPFNLLNFIDEIQGVFYLRAEQQGIHFTCQIDADMPAWVEADERRLRQILLNLLSNAVKFTHQGGVTLKISVLEQLTLPPRPAAQNGATKAVVGGSTPPNGRRLSIPSDKTVLGGQLATNGTKSSHGRPQPPVTILRFAVLDTGVGITQRQLDRIFFAFEQAGSTQHRAEGTGLDLSITRHLAAARPPTAVGTQRAESAGCVHRRYGRTGTAGWPAAFCAGGRAGTRWQPRAIDDYRQGLRLCHPGYHALAGAAGHI
jgi:signal transduction histidine kinase